MKEQKRTTAMAEQVQLTIETRKADSLRPHPFALQIPISKQDRRALFDSIRETGRIDPLHVTGNGKIIDGVNRWQIADQLGITEVPVIVFDYQYPEQEIVHAIRSNFRRHLTEGQKALLVLKLEPYEKDLAKRRQQEAGRIFGKGKTKANSDSSANACAKQCGGKASERLAAAGGVS